MLTRAWRLFSARSFDPIGRADQPYIHSIPVRGWKLSKSQNCSPRVLATPLGDAKGVHENLTVRRIYLIALVFDLFVIVLNLLAFFLFPVLPAGEIARRERFKIWLQR